jgi:SIR2-like domain
MWNWPTNIVQEVAERRAIFVIGAGASMASEDLNGNRPPSWLELLKILANKLNQDKEKKYALRLIGKGRYLEAAQVIQDSLDTATFSRLVNEQLKLKDYVPSKIHRAIFDIDPKVVVTTNYDQIYEKQFAASSPSDGHVVCRYYDSHIINDLRSSQRCVVKMHGCVDDSTKIVLSKTSYFNARNSCPSFYHTIDALFLVSTLIFVATSFDDPNLQMILENGNISAKSEHKHYIIIEKLRHASEHNILSKNYNLYPIEYKRGQHEQVSDLLEKLRDEVIEWRHTHD